MAIMSQKQQEKILKGLEERRKILEDAVVAVVRGFSPALFVWGAPGLGKSHLLTTMLEALADNGWRHHTGHSTPKGLFLSLYESPHAIHLYEDCEQVLKTDMTASILRAACGAPNQRERLITYKTAHEDLRCHFFGGVIIATNANLSRTNGPMQGVSSRFRPIRWDMTYEERIAMILRLSEREYSKMGVVLTKKECRKVALRLIEICASSDSDRQLDLRLYTEHALPAYAQAKESPSMKWEDLLNAKLSGVANTMQGGQEERTRALQQLAQKIDLEGGNGKEKIEKWKRLSECGPAMYYRHLKGGRQAAAKVK
jgi:hypothetical protein